mmetsp:Transcript_14152/g.46377  ORF Transcript_14152/g.46377 Transcript_14152/m.46377 type:complete len:246 (+) Transcript_14152:1214-1951(+)
MLAPPRWSTLGSRRCSRYSPAPAASSPSSWASSAQRAAPPCSPSSAPWPPVLCPAPASPWFSPTSPTRQFCNGHASTASPPPMYRWGGGTGRSTTRRSRRRSKRRECRRCFSSASCASYPRPFASAGLAGASTSTHRSCRPSRAAWTCRYTRLCLRPAFARRAAPSTTSSPKWTPACPSSRRRLPCCRTTPQPPSRLACRRWRDRRSATPSRHSWLPSATRAPPPSRQAPPPPTPPTVSPTRLPG